MALPCPTCGHANDDRAVFCSQCATNITGGGGVKYNPYAHAPAPQQYRASVGYQLPSRATTVLVLGILSLVVCGIMGPIAWSMGTEELRRIDDNVSDPTQRGTVTAGRVCGIIGTVLMVIQIFVVILWIVAFTAMTRHSTYNY